MLFFLLLYFFFVYFCFSIEWLMCDFFSLIRSKMYLNIWAQIIITICMWILFILFSLSLSISFCYFMESNPKIKKKSYPLCNKLNDNSVDWCKSEHFFFLFLCLLLWFGFLLEHLILNVLLFFLLYVQSYSAISWDFHLEWQQT